MKWFPLLWILLTASQGVASAQAMVENALGAGRAATSTGGAMSGLEKVLKKSLSVPEPRPAAAVATASAAVVVSAPAVHYEDPKLMETGTGYEELKLRFGPATLEITTSPLTKTLSYLSRDGAYQVEMREGKVTAITRR